MREERCTSTDRVTFTLLNNTSYGGIGGEGGTAAYR